MEIIVGGTQASATTSVTASASINASASASAIASASVMAIVQSSSKPYLELDDGDIGGLASQLPDCLLHGYVVLLDR